MKTPEGKIKDAVRRWLASVGAYRFSPVQMGIGAPTLDDLCCFGGKFLAIEYKAPGKTPTPRQKHTMNEIRRAGGVAIWGDHETVIIEQIKEHFGIG